MTRTNGSPEGSTEGTAHAPHGNQDKAVPGAEKKLAENQEKTPDKSSGKHRAGKSSGNPANGTENAKGAKNPRLRARLRVSAKIGIALAVLLAFLGVGDRWAVLYAEDKAATQVQESLHLRAKPDVRIPGFPFLTQLATEELDRADVTVTDAPGGRISVARVEGTTRDVRLVTGDSPLSVKGAVLGRTHGEVLLAFDDLDRELGTSQVSFHRGKHPDTVLADGRLPVAGRTVQLHATAHLRRIGRTGVGTTVRDMRLDVPGLFSYTPGEDGGLRLAEPLAERVRNDAAKVRALFRVGSVAQRFGLTPQRAARIRQSEAALHRLTGEPRFTERLMRVNLLDAALENPSLLKKFGIDPGLIDALEKLKAPKLADELTWSTRLPDSPGHIRIRKLSVRKDGIHAELVSPGLKFGATKG